MFSDTLYNYLKLETSPSSSKQINKWHCVHAKPSNGDRKGQVWIAFQAPEPRERSQIPCAKAHYGDRKQRPGWRWEEELPTARLDERGLYLDCHDVYTVAIHLSSLTDCAVSKANSYSMGLNRTQCLKTDQLCVD